MMFKKEVKFVYNCVCSTLNALNWEIEKSVSFERNKTVMKSLQGMFVH